MRTVARSGSDREAVLSGPMMRLRTIQVLALLLLSTACGPDGPAATPDGGGSAIDAATPREDAGGEVIDAGAGEADAGGGPGDGGADAGGEPGDAGGGEDAALDGGTDFVGEIHGTCGVLDDVELLGESPFFFANHIDFPMGFDDERDIVRLSTGSQMILSDGTAGGSSELSEVFAFEVLHRCEGAILIKSETLIRYEPEMSRKTDMLVEIDGHRIGVSVTRAVGFPRDAPYTVERAQMLLEGKLGDILVSSANVVPEDAWVKQILHVIAYADMHGESIMTAWEMIDASLRADTILWVTVSDGDDEFLYSSRRTN